MCPWWHLDLNAAPIGEGHFAQCMHACFEWADFRQQGLGATTCCCLPPTATTSFDHYML